jgi:integrase
MPIKIPSYIVKNRLGTYYLNVAVPRIIQPQLKKPRIRKSLRTKDLAQASRLSRLLLVWVDSFFSYLRDGGMSGDSDLEKELNDSLQELLDADASKKAKADAEEELQGIVGDEIVEWGKANPDASLREISEYASKSVLEREKPYAPVASDSVFSKSYKIPTKTTAKQQPTKPAYPDDPRYPRLNILFEQYLAEANKQRLVADNTITEWKLAFDTFKRIIGNIPVNQLDRLKAVEFQETLQKLPPGITDHKIYRDKDIPQILAMNPKRTLGISSINNKVTYMSRFCDWLRKKGKVKENYFDELLLSDPRAAHEKTLPLDEADLQKIFDHIGEVKETDPSMYWIPRIGLYTGCRVDEICQLYLSDVREIDGVLCFDINNFADDKKIKGQNIKGQKRKMQRLIPVHSVLIDLGLIAYRDGLVADGHERLFPELNRAMKGYSAAFQKRVNRLVRKAGVEDKRKTFRSLRNLFGEKLFNLDIDPVKIKALMGHSDPALKIQRGYTGPYKNIAHLKEAVEMLSFDVG